MEFVFYEIIAENLTSATVRLLEKVFISEERCICFAKSEDVLQEANNTLWTFSTKAFIPHGDRKFGFCEKQPIYFTNTIENPNNAENILMINNFDYQSWISSYSYIKKIMFVISNTEEVIKNANTLHQDLKKTEERVDYWKQSIKGWEKV